jgi:hypothetical protein
MMGAVYLVVATVMPVAAATLTYNAGTNILSVGIPIFITDTAGNPLIGQTMATIDLYYTCGGTPTQFNETGDTLTELDAGNDPGAYVWTSNDAVAATCAEPKLLTASGGGTDRNAWGRDVFDMRRAPVTGTVVSSADCTNSATLFDTDLAAVYTGTNGPREAGLLFTSGALMNEVRRIGGYNTNGCIAVNQAFSGTPSAGDAFTVVNQ